MTQLLENLTEIILHRHVVLQTIHTKTRNIDVFALFYNITYIKNHRLNHFCCFLLTTVKLACGDPSL